MRYIIRYIDDEEATNKEDAIDDLQIIVKWKIKKDIFSCLLFMSIFIISNFEIIFYQNGEKFRGSWVL